MQQITKQPEGSIMRLAVIVIVGVLVCLGMMSFLQYISEQPWGQ
ncbi:Uncharacterised protein [Serratia rubidaea]|nr:Uncharacterised protein [Serratia rubidaea]